MFRDVREKVPFNFGNSEILDSAPDQLIMVGTTSIGVWYTSLPGKHDYPVGRYYTDRKNYEKYMKEVDK